MRLLAIVILAFLGGAAGARSSAAAPCVDADGDGWADCDGDCCDGPGACGAVEAAEINPGAFEIAGNSVDDDCDATTPDTGAPTCDALLPSNASDPLDYARAMDLCAFTVEDPPVAQKRWGVVSAAWALADGTGTPAPQSRSIRLSFGSNGAQGGARFAVLSSGRAAAPGHTNPSPIDPQQLSANMGTSSPTPADWLAAHGGSAPVPRICGSTLAPATALDPILLKLRIRVPTNARSFSAKAFVFASDYPEYVCNGYADFFLALLDSGFTSLHPDYRTPADKNIAAYDPSPARRGPSYPLNADLAMAGRGVFSQCKNGPIGCADPFFVTAGLTMTTCAGTALLQGTGFDLLNPAPNGTGPGYCDANNLLGGGTGWLTFRANVEPGETIDLRLVIWDTSDPIYDSVVLIDDFEWSTARVKPGARP